MKKRLFSIILSVFLLATFVSCGNEKKPKVPSDSSTVSDGFDEGEIQIDGIDKGNKNSSSPNSSKGGSSSQPKAQEQTPIGTKIPKVSPNGTVTVCTPWNSRTNWVVGWTNAYKKIYGLKVDYRVVDPSLLPTRLASWKQSGDSPDIVFGDISTEWPLLVNKNFVDPVDKYIDINDNFWKTVKPAIEASKVGGKPYMMITDMSPFTAVVYSKKVFQDAGLEDPRSLYFKGQWTWEKFMEYAKLLTKKTGNASTERYGLCDGYYEGLIATSGKDVITATENDYVINLDDPNIVRVMGYLANLGIVGENVVYKNPDTKTMHDNLVSGKVAMWVGPNAQLEWPNELKQGLLSWSPTPKDTKASGGKHYEGFNATGFFICKGAKNPTAGVAFAQAVRSLAIPSINPDARNQAKSDFGYTDDDYNLLDYRVANNTPVFMDFRRFQPNFYYHEIWGPIVFEGKSWSSVVNEIKPKLVESINKLK